MNSLNRRNFLKTTVAGTGVLALSPNLALSADLKKATKARSAVDRVLLGRTGIKASFLAQGTGVHGGARQSDHTRMGQKAFSYLMHHGFDQGINFLDMADLYGTHPFMRQAMKEVPREKYVTLSKIWTRQEKWVTPSGGAAKEVDRFRKELNIDVLDICLIHCMMDAQWPEKQKRVRDELSELKAKGIIRAVGISCHDHGAMQTAATHPWVDVLLARINNKGGREYKMDGSVKEISATLKTARANGKAVVGMKLFAEGKLIKPEEKDASLEYVLGNGLVDAVTIGMRKVDEIDDSVQRIDRTFRV
jgi:predicted aldo/keto reductase-like oxidoreductase